MKAAPTKIILIGQNDMLINSVKNIIPASYVTARSYPAVDEVKNLVEYFQADIVIFCLNNDVDSFAVLASRNVLSRISIVVVGQTDELYAFENRVFIRGAHFLTRPVKSAALKAVLKKCEDEKRIRESGKKGRKKGGSNDKNVPEVYVSAEEVAPYEEEPETEPQEAREARDVREETEEEYRHRECTYISDEPVIPEIAERTERYEDIPEEIIRIPASRYNSSKLHSDDILRIPPEKGRYFRNAVREKPVKKVRTVIEEEYDYTPHRPTHISGKFSILVVDDDVQILGAVRKFLQDDYFVTTVPSGKMAYKFIDVNVVDVIILDYVMRDEDGPAVLKTLRANPKTADIPVIFLTGVSDKERVMNVLALNPQGYLLKPINRQELLDAIAKALE